MPGRFTLSSLPAVAAALFAGLLCFPASCKKETDRPVVFRPTLSFTVNPDGQWETGYSAGSILSMAEFRRSTASDNMPLIALWTPSADPVIAYPYTGQNRTSMLQVHSSGRWAARAHQVVMEASNSGQYAMLRFRAARSGRYRIRVTFEGLHTGLSTTDVHVMKNDTELFSDNISGYGGDPAFHVIEGPHPSAVYEGTSDLAENDIVTFAVGYGENETHYNDTTGLDIVITLED